MTTLELRVLDGSFAVWQLPPGTLPDLEGREFLSMSWTARETSVVGPEDAVPESHPSDRGWRCLEVAGPLAFQLTGVLASLSGTLADAGLPIFVVSTYHTDYVMVKADDLDAAITALRRAGHVVA
jgi:hypothetical protein